MTALHLHLSLNTTSTRTLWRQRLALAVAGAALGLGTVCAQAQSGAAAAAQGRPAMAGAQGGLGAQPGLQQGGLGNKAANDVGQVDIPLKRPGTQPTEKAVGPREDRIAVRNGSDIRLPDDGQVAPKRTEEVRPTQSTTAKAARATKRSVERARTGVSPVDATVAIPKP